MIIVTGQIWPFVLPQRVKMTVTVLVHQANHSSVECLCQDANFDKTHEMCVAGDPRFDERCTNR
ncbi:hypothetical protein DIPPA_05370 [Diplonema papillatum]|nr:hypothetical protein DIPPA_05370 [Diplonema papillatum]